MSRKLRPSVACVGAGRLARVVLPSLAAAGWPVVAVAASRRSSSRRLCRVLPGARAVGGPGQAASNAELLLLAVPDREIVPLAAELAEEEKIDWSERVVLHHAGSLGLEPLAPLARAGAAVGVLHPLQCLGHPRQARKLLSGSRARLEGRGRALSLARRAARDLGLVPLRFPRPLSATDRAAYHTAAALLSNDLVAQLSLGVQLLETCGLPRADAIAALTGLARGTLAQTETAGGLASALTGPVVRGDVEVVAAHLEQLARHSPDAADIHRLLSRRLLWLAEQAGNVPDTPTLRRLRRLLRRPAAGRRRTTTV